MGTNYFWYPKPPCPTCGHQEEPIHIGKSSAGWVFALHVDPEKGIHDLPDWEDRWKTGEIRDEYGHALAADEMRLVVMARARDIVKYPPMSADWYYENEATPGPAGLARAKLGHNVIGHGVGTWDLHIGEFS